MTILYSVVVAWTVAVTLIGAGLGVYYADVAGGFIGAGLGELVGYFIGVVYLSEVRKEVKR